MSISAASGVGSGQSLAQMAKWLSQMQAGRQTQSLNNSIQDASNSDTSTQATSSTTSSSTEDLLSELQSFFQNALSSDTMGGLLQAQGGQPDSGHHGLPPSGGGSGGGAPPELSDIDSDGDGALSQSEMEAYGTSVHGDADTTKADKLFASMDTDGNGSVTADEKTAFDDQMKANRPKGPPPAGAMSQTDESGTSDAATSSENLAKLMEDLMNALQSYKTSTASATATASTTSVAA